MKLLSAFLLLSAALVVAETSTVLAKIGDIEISSGEIQEVVSGLDPAQQAALAKDPTALSKYVRALLVQRMVLKQATGKNWDQDPAVIATLVRAREAALAESFLQSHSSPEAGYPSDTEVTEAYESNKEKFLVPRTYHLAQIFIANDKAKLDATVKQLKLKNADFEFIAKSASEEPASAARGGEIGWLTDEQIQPEIRAKLPTLKLNTVSEPIQLADGWHILKVLDIRESNTPTLDQIRDQLIAKLRSERAQLKRQEYLAQLMRENPVAINEIELGKIGAPPTPGTKP